jgi:DNA-binding NarL/FixJ family response regulator
MKILFADDDERYRQLLRAAFSMIDGVEVVGEAADGVEAVELAATTGPDVVLLDVEMPRMDGFAAAVAIREARPATRILLHTGELLHERRTRADDLGLVVLDKLRVYETVDVASSEPVGDP